MEKNLVEGESEDQLGQIEAKIKLEKLAKSGASWFYWIAGLSIANSVAYLTGVSLFFVVGLGITQFIQGFAIEITSLDESGNLNGLQIIAFILSIVISTGFIGIGYLARKGQIRIYIIGMVLYALDALLVILFVDILGFAFHLVALIFLYAGLRATRILQAIEAGDLQIETAMQSWPLKSPFRPRDRTQDRAYWSKLGLFALILAPMIIITILCLVVLAL